MKKTNILNRFALTVLAMLMVGGIFASNNFYAWDMTTERSGANGIACGSLSFEEKDFTIELWLNIPTSNLTNGVTIASTRHDGTHGFSLDIAADGRLRGFFRNDNGDKLNGRTDYVFPFFFEKPDFADKWVHIAIVFSSTDNVARSYLNGEVYQDLVKNADPYTPYSIGWVGNFKPNGDNVGAMRLGHWYEAAGQFYGKVADFRIWSVGRTDAQIKENYNKNLQGTYEDNPGLYLNYRFYTYERGFINDANPSEGANKGWCNPEAGWNNYYGRETLAVSPKNLTLDPEDKILSWDAADGEWEVAIHRASDGELVYTDTISTNSKNLQVNGLTTANYYAKVRNVNNGFWSGQVQSENFQLVASSVDKVESSLSFKVVNATLVVNVDQAQTLNIYSVSGQLIRSVNLVAGENQIQGLAKGLYIANNHKIVIR